MGRRAEPRDRHSAQSIYVETLRRVANITIGLRFLTKLRNAVILIPIDSPDPRRSLVSAERFGLLSLECCRILRDLMRYHNRP